MQNGCARQFTAPHAPSPGCMRYIHCVIILLRQITCGQGWSIHRPQATGQWGLALLGLGSGWGSSLCPLCPEGLLHPASQILQSNPQLKMPCLVYASSACMHSPTTDMVSESHDGCCLLWSLILPINV